MPIDTAVNGDPGSIRDAARWLATGLQPQIQAAADALARVRTDATTAWQGQAGAAFARRMAAGARGADKLTDATERTARALTACADELARIQQQVAGIRADAAAAGLVVTAAVIHEPVPPPDEPPTLQRTPAEAAAHDQATAAVRAYHLQAAAYSRAAEQHSQARAALELLMDTLKNVWDEVTGKWFFTTANLVGGAAETLAALNASILAQESRRLATDSATTLERFRTAPTGTPARLMYDDLDRAARLSAHSKDLAESASRIESTTGKLAFRAGAGLAVAGVIYDIHKGKPVEQAVVSGGAGFAASIAAGAVIGSLIPLPVAGTAMGAIGGAAAGLFVSGAVDSAYQDGVLSVRQAFEGGTEVLQGTRQVVTDLGRDVWRAIF